MDNRLLASIEKPEDLTIVTFLWNLRDWAEGRGIEYLNRLYRAVERNLTLPHRFVCFSEKKTKAINSGIEVLALNVPQWRRNLRKLIMYKPNNGLTGRVLALDLDIVITGNIDDIAGYNGRFCVCAYQMGGSLVGFKAGTMTKQLWRPMKELEHTEHIQQKTTGSERRYYKMKLEEKPDFWQELYPGQICSFKQDCHQELPKDAKIVYFHGKPKPHNRLGKGWIKDNWI